MTYREDTPILHKNREIRVGLRRNKEALQKNLSKAEAIIEDLVNGSGKPSKEVYRALALQQVPCEGVSLLLGIGDKELQAQCKELTGDRYDILWGKFNQMLITKLGTQMILGTMNPADVRYMYRKLQGDGEV